MRISKKVKGVIIGVVAAVAVLACTGAILGATGTLTRMFKDRSEDNLITMRSIKAAGIELEEGKKSKVSDVTMTVDEDGVLKLEGIASDDDALLYAKLELDAGTYRFSGAPDSTKKTYQLVLTDGVAVYHADDEDVIVLEDTTEVLVQVLIYEDCDFGSRGQKLYPVIWEVEDSEDDTVVKFWE